MIDPEAESAAIKERSLELAQLLDAAVPVLDRSAIREVEAEAAKLARLARAARAHAAIQVAAGLDLGPGVVVGRVPAIRRVRTDNRGRDLDPLKGRPCITPALTAYWRHQLDVVGPTTEGSYQRAMLDRPWSTALVSAVNGHLGALGLRQSKAEGAEGLLAALKRYKDSYSVLRDGAHDAQGIVSGARAQLANLERAVADALVGDEQTTVSGLIAAAVSMATDGPVDAKTLRPVGSPA